MPSDSNPYGDPQAVSITEESFHHGSLRILSFARPGKLFTANTSLMVGEVGMLKLEVPQRIVKQIIEVLRGGIE